jgi:hypothetical protein
MQNIERRVWREARVMTRREVITKAIAKQLSWVQASEILGISAGICGGYGTRSNAREYRR